MHVSTAPFIEFGGNDTLALDKRFAIWRVESGVLDVFTANVDRSITAARRTLVHRFHPGAIIFSTPIDRASCSLIAVPAGSVRLSEIGAAHVERGQATTEMSRILVRGLDEWIEALSAGVLSAVTPKDHLEPHDGGWMMVEAGTPIRSTQGIFWTVVEDGEGCIAGREDISVSGGSAGWIPIGSHIWFEPTSVTKLCCVRTVDRLARGELPGDMISFHSIILQAAVELKIRRQREEARRIRRKEALDRTVFGAALGRLANVMSQEAGEAQLEGDLLVEACRVVARAVGIEIVVPPEHDRETSSGRLTRIASASRFRTRRVALRGEWWRHDAGPLLGVRLSENESIRTPVALLPTAGGRYVLIDPRSRETCPVRQSVAVELDPFAFSFYKPFEKERMRALDLIRFGSSFCRRDLAKTLLMGAAGGILGLVPPIVTGIIFNRIIPGADRIQLLHFIIALLVCALASALFQLVRGFAVLRIETKLDATIQPAVWDRLLNLPVTFFRKFTAGDLAVRAGGISEIRRLLSGATISSLLSGLFSLLNLGLLFYYDARLAAWACGMTILAVGVMLCSGYVQLRYQRQVTAAQSRLTGQVLQYITGITKLRVAGAEAKAYGRWATEFAAQRRLQFKARRVANGLTTFNSSYALFSMMAIFVLMLASDPDAVMSTGHFIAFNGAYGAFTSNMLGMTGAFMAILMALPIYEQVRPILTTPPEIDESKADPGRLLGHLEVSHVSFRYERESGLILDDISLRAGSGEFVALVGPSGSGKSTLLRLLLGFEQPEEGSIYVDGRDLARLDIQAVRRQIGVVLQNGSVMTGDLFSNICGSTLATMDDAWTAARMAGLEDDIRQMPMGMHTVISEGGATLSGGQRQRLMIARAIVHRPRILLFDEATSALDNRTQAIVSESLERLQATRIVVAHRLSTIINADNIYVFESGRIVQQGSYGKLLTEGGVFADLVRRQIA